MVFFISEYLEYFISDIIKDKRQKKRLPRKKPEGSYSRIQTTLGLAFPPLSIEKKFLSIRSSIRWNEIFVSCNLSRQPFVFCIILLHLFMECFLSNKKKHQKRQRKNDESLNPMVFFHFRIPRILHF